MKQTFTDTEIINAIKRGEADDVLAYLYQTVQYQITDWIIKNNGDREEAQDIFQDAVISFYKYVLAGKFIEGKSVGAFLFTIGKNRWINRVKQKNRMQRENTAESHKTVFVEENNVLSNVMDQERAEKLQSYFNQLGDRCKELLTLSIFNNLGMEEISQRMDFSNANTAKTKNYKCKKRLIQVMRADKNINDWLYK